MLVVIYHYTFSMDASCRRFWELPGQLSIIETLFPELLICLSAWPIKEQLRRSTSNKLIKWSKDTQMLSHHSTKMWILSNHTLKSIAGKISVGDSWSVLLGSHDQKAILTLNPRHGGHGGQLMIETSCSILCSSILHKK